jgi:hypothetical protein
MNRGVLSDQVQVLDLFLAMDAARCFRRGLEPRRFDGNTTVGAFAIGARLDACQCRINRRQFYQFPLAQGEFKFALGCELGARVFRVAKMVSRDFRAADGTPALFGNLRQQRSTHAQQLLLVRGGVILVDSASCAVIEWFDPMVNHVRQKVFDRGQDRSTQAGVSGPQPGFAPIRRIVPACLLLLPGLVY